MAETFPSMNDHHTNAPNSSRERYSMLKRFLYKFSKHYRFKFNDNNEYGTPRYRLVVWKALYLCFANDTHHLRQLFPHYPENVFPESLDELLDSVLLKPLETPHNENNSTSNSPFKLTESLDNQANSKDIFCDFQLNKNYIPGHPHTVCSKIFQKYEPYFRCLTCSSDDTCALCYHCFDPQFHAGHNVKKFICVRSNSGKCDCGDPDSWKNSDLSIHHSCEYRKISQVEENNISALLKTSMYSTIECAVDYIIDVLFISRSGSEDSHYLYDENSLLPIPPDSNVFDVESYGINKDEDPQEKIENNGYYLVLYNDQSKHLSEAISKIRKATMKVPEFAEMIALQCHEKGRSIVLASNDYSFLVQRQRILNSNLSTDPSHSNNFNCSPNNNSNKYYSVIKSREEFFREEICFTICEWLNDLLKGPVFGNFTLTNNLISMALCCKWTPGIKDLQTTVDKNISNVKSEFYPSGFKNYKIPVFPLYYDEVEVDLNESAKYWKSYPKNLENPTIDDSQLFVSDKLLKDCDYDPYLSNTNVLPIHGSRFQYLLVLDISLWKKFRILVQSMFIVTVSNPTYMSILACQYADIYPTLSELMMSEDRDVEWNSTNHLSVQIFTNSQIATIYCSPLRNDLLKILNVAQGFLVTGHIFPFQLNSQILPKWFTMNGHRPLKDFKCNKKFASLDSTKLRRWNLLFFDLNFLVSRAKNPKELFEKRLLDSLYNILEFFQGVPVLKREAVEHVEYEATDYPLYFSAVTSILTFCKNQIGGVSKLTSLENQKDISAFAITGLLQKFLSFMDICLLSRLTEDLNLLAGKNSDSIYHHHNDSNDLSLTNSLPHADNTIDRNITTETEDIDVQNNDIIINVGTDNTQNNQQGQRNIVIMDVNAEGTNDENISNNIGQERPSSRTNEHLTIKSDVYLAIKYHEVTIHEQIFEDIIDFKVHEEHVSFLHPLSSYLSYLIELSEMKSPHELLELIFKMPVNDEHICFKMDDLSEAVIDDCLKSFGSSGSSNKSAFLTDDQDDFSSSFHYEIRTLFENNKERVKNRKNILQIIHDFSLRAIVLASQIKVGFWVRNGLSIKSQLYNYRNLGLRELGFMRDLHIVQLYSCVSPAELSDTGNFFTATLLDRWGLVDWANFEYSKNLLVYDCVETLQFIVEEFLIFLINFLETNDNLIGLNNSDVNSKIIKSQILHFLCFKLCSFAELCKELPDHISNDKMFDTILNNVAIFYGPQAMTESMEDVRSFQKLEKNDIGRYKLKEEYYDDINPYYIHYNSNKRDDAEKLVKDMMLKELKNNPELNDDTKRSLSFNDMYVTPKKIELSSFFGTLFQFTSSEAFINFLRSCLIICLQNGKFTCQVNVEEDGDIFSTILLNNISYDGILRFTLHLIHICLCNDTYPIGVFARRCLKSSIQDSEILETIILMLYKLLTFQNNQELSVDISPFIGKIKAIFMLFRKLVPALDSYLSENIIEYDIIITLHPWDKNYKSQDGNGTNNPSTQAVYSEAEKKKLKAAERRAKIMAALKKQQNSFIEKNNVDINESSNINNSQYSGDDITDDSNYSNHISGCSCDLPSLGKNKGWKFPEESCILCQMPASSESDVFGTLCYVTESSEFRNIPAESNYWTCKAFAENYESKNDFSHPLNELEERNVIGPGFPTDKPFSLFTKHVIAGCGHGMHLSCFKHHLKTTRKRLTHFTKTLPEDISNKEFICPLCKGLCNCLLPILSKSNGGDLLQFVKPNSNSEWHDPFENLQKSLGENYLDRIYTSLLRDRHDTLQPKYHKLFHSCEMEPDRILLEDTYDMLTELNEAIKFIMSSYMGDNISLLLANTIESTEILLRINKSEFNNSNENFAFHRIPSQILTNLRVLADFGKNLEFFECQILESNKENIIYKYLSSFRLLCSEDFFEFENIDYFETLVESLNIKDMGFSFNSIMTMCLYGEILKTSILLVNKILCKSDFLAEDSHFYDLPGTNYVECETIKNSRILVDKLLSFTSCPLPGHAANNSLIGPIFYNMLLKCILPFLRKCAILSYVVAPIIDEEKLDFTNASMNEEENLSKFLDVPTLSTFISQMLNRDTFEGNIFFELSKKLNQQHIKSPHTFNKLQIKYPGKIELINLPKRLDSFFVDYFYKNFSDLVNYDPAVCLCCGKVVKFQQYSIGMKHKGECNFHYEQSCAKDCGLFFLPKHISILVLYKGNGSFYDAPYYDEHGELANSLKELGSKHMQPYYLNEKKYQQFMQDIWLLHNSANYVIRKLENSVDVGGWETL